MKKNVFGRKFKRDKNERAAFFKGLLSALVLNEKIRTTEARAKAIKGDADKIITKAKKNKDVAKRVLTGLLNKEALEKLVNDLAPRISNRNGGYTRIIRIGNRFGDDAMEVMIEWTEGPLPAEPNLKTQKSKVKTKTKRLAPRAGKKEKGKGSSAKKNKK